MRSCSLPPRGVCGCKSTVNLGVKRAGTPIAVRHHRFAHIAADGDCADLVRGGVHGVSLAKSRKRAARKKHFAGDVVTESFYARSVGAWWDCSWSGTHTSGSCIHMDEFMNQRKRLGHGGVLVIDDDEWCNLISNCKSTKHAFIEIGMVGTKISNQQHEDTKRFDSSSENSELLG